MPLYQITRRLSTARTKIIFLRVKIIELEFIGETLRFWLIKLRIIQGFGRIQILGLDLVHTPTHDISGKGDPYEKDFSLTFKYSFLAPDPQVHFTSLFLLYGTIHEIFGHVDLASNLNYPNLIINCAMPY